MVDNEGVLVLVAEMNSRIQHIEAAMLEGASFRKKLKRRMLLLLGGSGLAFAGAALAITTSGVGLFQFMDFGPGSVALPVLDTSVRLSRSDPVGVAAGHTNEILSVISEATQANSYTWPLYVQLKATNNPLANIFTSQSVGITARTFQRSSGSPWLAGMHSELFHGQNDPAGPAVATNGTSILYNAELTSKSSTGDTIGLNILNTADSTVRGDYAIQIQPGTMGWENGIRFAGGNAGNIGINFDSSSYAMGIDLQNNSLRINANQRIYLEKFGTVYIQFNSATGRVEVVRGGVVVSSM